MVLPRFGCHEKRDVRSSRPQSFVTSHQKEYNELIAAANSLGNADSKKKKVIINIMLAYQKRKSASPCKTSFSVPCSSMILATTVLWAAERKMTGNEEAYLSAL